VPPASSHVLSVSLTSKVIGPVRVPFYVKILGWWKKNQLFLTFPRSFDFSHFQRSTFSGHSVPYPINLDATSVGPRVLVEPLSFDFGNVKCLQPVTKTIRLTNDSCIDATLRWGCVNMILFFLNTGKYHYFSKRKSARVHSSNFTFSLISIYLSQAVYEVQE
jgi:hypothetical protein